jgi:hypothetical protein
MKTDDFEKQLQEQPLRPVPGHWRSQILEAARQSVREESSDDWNKVTFLHRLFWPNPQAWGALAAIWVVVFALNFAGADPEPKLAASPAPSTETMLALKEQRQLRAELLSAANDVPVAEPPKLSAPHSRIDPINQIIAV